MARRYGRNQKRQHRQQIAELTAEVANEKQYALNACDAAEKLRRRIDNWKREIVRLLGSNSAFLEQVEKHLSRVYGPGQRLRVEAGPTKLARGPLSFELGNIAADDSYHHVMDIAIMYLEKHADEYIDQIRFMVNTPDDDRIGYAMSGEMYREHGFGDQDIEWLAMEIARSMASHINNR